MDLKYYCPRCDKFIGDPWGPLNGARVCPDCKKKAKKQNKDGNSTKDAKSDSEY